MLAWFELGDLVRNATMTARLHLSVTSRLRWSACPIHGHSTKAARVTRPT